MTRHLTAVPCDCPSCRAQSNRDARRAAIAFGLLFVVLTALCYALDKPAIGIGAFVALIGAAVCASGMEEE